MSFERLKGGLETVLRNQNKKFRFKKLMISSRLDFDPGTINDRVAQIHRHELRRLGGLVAAGCCDYTPKGFQ